LKSKQGLSICKIILCTELGLAQCYSTDPVGFGQRRLPTALSATAHRAAAVPTMPASLHCRRRVSLLPHLLYVPAMQQLIPFFIPMPLYPAQSHTTATESTAAPLCPVTLTLSRPPHCPPTRHSTTDRSSGRSPTTLLRLSCRERLHAHRCLRSSSIPATTP
jgi:hypothetical protein